MPSIQLGLTCSLQAEAKDIVAAVSEVKCVVSTLTEIRKIVDKNHKEWFDQVETMCEYVGDRFIDPALLPTSCEYYCGEITVP